MSSISTSARTGQAARTQERYLFGPFLDFALLGGGSLIALLSLRLWLGNGSEARAWSLGVTLAIANIINHPHFAHSYQIFYSGFRDKLSSPTYSPELRARYLHIGVTAPLLILCALAVMVVTESARGLGLAANAMFFLVGWHYAKQGYGMAMVDAVLKRRFYGDAQKRWLLRNAHATWIFAWLLANHLIAQSTREYWGVEYFVIPVPFWALIVSGACCAATLTTLLHRLQVQKRSTGIAWNGLLAYCVSIYAWLLIRDPIVLLWVPMFHSLQYMAVVWRFQSNRARTTQLSIAGNQVGRTIRLVMFAAFGFILGYLGFWVLPETLNTLVPYDRDVFGGLLFFYLFWIFINIHHYLLDTVMWRKGNPDVSRHLFG
ncbi:MULTISPECIES: hypothetical protein [Luteimonas]|uniref:hypothetical protein n=1 Tax=Luteimonas TaxID=83614 RepID=UPI000C7B1011|nr:MULTISPECIES: hypothetical protein [Luteimonas]